MDAQMIPMPGYKKVTCTTVFEDTNRLFVDLMKHLPDGRVLLVNYGQDYVYELSADFQFINVPAKINNVNALAVLPDGHVLVATNTQIIQLSADFRELETVAGRDEQGNQDGDSLNDARFYKIRNIAVLPDDRVLIAETNCIRMLSADRQQVSTVAGVARYSEVIYRDGNAKQARFDVLGAFAVLPDGRVLVAENQTRVLMLSADLQQVSTVAGNDQSGYQDGDATKARFNDINDLAVLPDGRVLILEFKQNHLRVLSKDLQTVSTLIVEGLHDTLACDVLPDSRVIVSSERSIFVLEGLRKSLPVFKPAAGGQKRASTGPPVKSKRSRFHTASGGGAATSSHDEDGDPGGGAARSSHDEDGNPGGGATAFGGGAATSSDDEDGDPDEPLLLHRIQALKF